MSEKTWKQAVDEAFEIRERRECAIVIEKQVITIYLADDVNCVIRRDGEHAKDAAFEGTGILSVEDILDRVRRVWRGASYSGIVPRDTDGKTAALAGFIADEACSMSLVALKINMAVFAAAWEAQPWRNRAAPVAAGG